MLLSLLLLPLAFAESYTLYHRHLPKGEYSPRGTVSIEEGVATFSSSSDIPESDAPWYQVALDVGGNLITSSTRSVSQLYAEADRSASPTLMPS